MQINKSENRNITKSLIHGLKKVFNCTSHIITIKVKKETSKNKAVLHV